MKLTIFLFFLAISQIMAVETYSQSTRLSLNLKSVAVKDVLDKIEEKSEFVFLYNSKLVDVDRTVSMDFKNEKISEILDKLFQETNVVYTVVDRQIVLTSKADQNSFLQFSQQQLKSVSGKVTDSSGGSMPGVSMVVKGTTTGTITDAHGNYSLGNVPENATLQFSFIGMKAQEVPIGNKTLINITLMEEEIGLEEVVAIGYGTQKKINLTGAIATVSSTVLESRPITSLGQGLEGTIANLNISPGDGEPGRAPKFNIRGYTGLENSESSASPLILVDGVQMDANLVNPSDIETLTVLKDAASAAIYGGRAAYGVILITTKAGKKNQAFRLNYLSNYSFSSPTIVPKLANSMQAIAYGEAAFGATPMSQDLRDLFQAHFNDPSQPYADLQGDTWRYYANTNWYDEAIRKSAPFNKQDINISGGTDKITYFVSLGTMDQGGLFKYGSDSYKRYNASVDLSIDLKSWLTFNFKSKYTKVETDAPTRTYMGSYWNSIVREAVMLPVKNPDGQWQTQLNNPLEYISDAARYTKSLNDSWVTLGMEVRPFSGFKIKGDFSHNFDAINERDSKRTLFITLPTSGIIRPVTYTTNPYAWQQNTTTSYNALNAWAEYEKTLNEKHQIKAMMGFNQEKSVNRWFNAKRFGLINQNIGEISLATGDQEANSSVSDWAVRGAFYRLNYIYDNKYLFESNGRYDGSSKFPKKDRFGFFPSFSAGWRISNEAFMEWMKPVVNELKFRASYGSLGNQDVSSNYPYISTINVHLSDPNFGWGEGWLLDGRRQMSADPSNLISPSLTWEKVSTLDFGADYSMLNNRFVLSYDWYNRKTDGILGTMAAPAILGTDPSEQNLYNMGTTGWELTISWKDRIGSAFKYYVGINLSDYQGKVLKYDANPTNYIFDFYNGQNLGEIWGWKVDNLFQTNEEATAWENKYKQSLVFGTPKGGYMAGDMKFEDVNNDGAITVGDATVANHGDRIVIGNNTPRYSFGVNGGFEWKGFDFNMFFQGVGKRDWQLGSGNKSNLLWGPEGRAWVYNLDYWSPENPNAYYPRVGSLRVSETTRYLQNAAYIRLKSLVLGYSLPQNVLEKVGIAKLRIYFSGQNLLTFTKLCKGVDPEAIVDPSGWGQGEVYPISKAISLGLNVTF